MLLLKKANCCWVYVQSFTSSVAVCYFTSLVALQGETAALISVLHHQTLSNYTFFKNGK